jgi:hypothetical protein
MGTLKELGLDWVLTVFAASNMSGITTTQGAIAEDLDAYATATWFTSVYLVCIDPLYWVETANRDIDSNVKYLTAGS